MLSSLILKNNQIWDLGISNMKEGLIYNKTLVHLDLNYNGIGE